MIQDLTLWQGLLEISIGLGSDECSWELGEKTNEIEMPEMPQDMV